MQNLWQKTKEKVSQGWAWVKSNTKKTLIATGVVILAYAGFGAPDVKLATVEEIELAQEAYFQLNGKYLQVLEGGVLPPYEAGSLKERLGNDIDPKYTIHIYKTPKGEQGYELRWEDENFWYRRGYGAESESRTATIEKPENVASTTPER